MVDARQDVPPGLLDGPLPFGRHFSSHMALMRHADGKWSDLDIAPHQPLSLSPATAAFHYAQCVFEGLKAYRHADGRVALFRIDQNAARMASSCRIMCMAELPEGAFVRAVRALVSTDRAWVPSRPGTSLYVRPAMIATDPLLGVHPSSEYLFFVIASPVGAYFTRSTGGAAPSLRILATDKYVRVPHGGVGAAKTAGNYAASLRPAQEAKRLGFDQVLYLDSTERRWCEELGAANVMFVIDGRVVTPPLGDSVLPGVTRDSLMKLAPMLGYEMVERPVSIDELVDGIGSG
ncbi:MAG: branched-chain amino acid aminotransferase, partial [Deltaproteobacteria bacterium]|nr:branched-chain amino acid aminotransferase [Deltaproteobacteria bacterium]